jgi:major vault protein
MVIIPPRNYCVIENPVLKDNKGSVLFDENGQAKLSFADTEIRFSGLEPFPLYPVYFIEDNNIFKILFNN